MRLQDLRIIGISNIADCLTKKWGFMDVEFYN